MSGAKLLGLGGPGQGNGSRVRSDGRGHQVEVTGPDLSLVPGGGVPAHLGPELGILLVVPAISPLATGLPGLVLLAWTALLAVSAHRALAWIPLQAHSFGAGFRVLLLNGTLALAGAAMIIPLFLPGRWHGRVRYGDEEDEDLGLPAPTGLLS